jgi:hypothetical protein
VNFLPEKNQLQKIELKIPIYGLKKIPSAEGISSLGFDKISESSSFISAIKIDSKDIYGRPYNFVEIELHKTFALLRYSVPEESHLPARRLRATLLFIRFLSLFPSIKIDVSNIGPIVLPVIEFSEKLLTQSYESVLEKLKISEEERKQLLSQKSKLSSSLEKSSSLILDLQKENRLLKARLEKLEEISERELKELILDWIVSHQGAINLPSFSSTYKVPLTRCEEVLDKLIKEGTIKEISKRYSVNSEELNRKYVVKGSFLEKLEISQIFSSIKKILKR